MMASRWELIGKSWTSRDRQGALPDGRGSYEGQGALPDARGSYDGKDTHLVKSAFLGVLLVALAVACAAGCGSDPGTQVNRDTSKAMKPPSMSVPPGSDTRQTQPP
jgi:hypothetical protein